MRNYNPHWPDPPPSKRPGVLIKRIKEQNEGEILMKDELIESTFPSSGNKSVLLSQISAVELIETECMIYIDVTTKGGNTIWIECANKYAESREEWLEITKRVGKRYIEINGKIKSMLEG